jgi:hypothetical protein
LHQGVFNQALRQESKQWGLFGVCGCLCEATCPDLQAQQHVSSASGDVGKSLLELAQLAQVQNSSKQVGSQSWPRKAVAALHCQGPHQTCMTTTAQTSYNVVLVFQGCPLQHSTAWYSKGLT